MEHTNSELTALEAFFLDAGLPVSEVEACPVPGCPACALALTRAVLAVLPEDKVARHNQLALESMLKRTNRP